MTADKATTANARIFMFNCTFQVILERMLLRV
jgi:hypothetical protein